MDNLTVRSRYLSSRGEAFPVSALTIVLVAVSAFVLGFALSRTGIFGSWFGGNSNSDVLINKSSGGVADFDHFWEVWDVIRKNYLDEEVTNSAMLEGAIKGVADSLEDFGTVYMTSTEYSDYKLASSGDFEGIGVYLERENSNVVISSVIKGTPAEAAGLASGDVILAVDGTSIVGKTPEDAATLIRGPEGTKVTLNVRSLNSSIPRDVEITRAAVHSPSLIIEGKADGIIYLEIGRFTELTLDEWVSEWDRTALEIKDQNPDVIIVDLRYNSGGFLEAGVHAAEEFLHFGKMVTAQEMPRTGNKITYTVDREGLFAETRTLVLVGRYTASAAEIFAGALQKNSRALVIGEKTFGKGTAQSIFEFSDGSALKLTVAHWLLPDGSVLSKDNTITPDIVVEYNSEHAEKRIDDILNRALEEAKKF